MATKLSELPSAQIIGVASNGALNFSSTTSGAGSKDLGLARNAAGNLRVTNGSSGTGSVNFNSLVEAHTSGDTLLATETGTTHTNAGAAGAITIVLPAATALGCTITFVVVVAQNLVVDAAGTDLIRIGASVTAAGGTATNAVAGSVLTLRNVVAGSWYSVGTPTGTWTLA
jgi:hypothetical protein